MKLLYEKETYLIRGVCFNIYKQLGFVHKEVIYQNALYQKLTRAGFKIEKEKRIAVNLDGKRIGIYQPDLIVNDKILIEVKAKSFLLEEDIAQFWYYLKCSDYKLGLLINFGKPNGIKIVRRIYTK